MVQGNYSLIFYNYAKYGIESIVHESLFLEILPGNSKAKKDTNPKNMAMEKNAIFEVLAAGTLGLQDVNFPCYRETIPSSFTTMPNMGLSQLCMIALESYGGEFIDCPVVENEDAIRVSCDVLSKGNSGDDGNQLPNFMESMLQTEVLGIRYVLH